jgi:hypothetical protein
MRNSAFGYSEIVRDQLIGILRRILENVSVHGFVGEHHLRISFDPRYAGVVLPEGSCPKGAEKIAIHLQKWFSNLVVSPTGFSVTLHFQDGQKTVTVPFDAICRFEDPHAELVFELTHFQPQRPATGSEISGNVLELARFRRSRGA